MRARTAAAVAIATAIAITVTACDSTPTADPALDDLVITVASFDFDESEVLAQLYAGALRASGFPVDRVARVGTREVVLPALERGLIDVVPEYAGSAVEFLGGQATIDGGSAHETLRALLGPRGIEVADAAPAQSRNGLVVTAATAAEHALVTTSDLREIAPQMTLGGPPECPDRDLCLLGFAGTYGLEFGAFLPLDAGGPITAEAIRRGTIDVGVLFTSDGSLVDEGLVLLEDDRRLQPAENVTPLVRRAIVDRFGPGVVEVLDDVSSRLTTDELQRLNALVRGGTTPRKAAARWLTEHGLAEDPG
jgi:osmoprotectant transport system substrate-binding protein